MENKLTEQEQKCTHEWVGYNQCCYCGAFENGAGKIFEERNHAGIEDLRQRFSEWYF